MGMIASISISVAQDHYNMPAEICQNVTIFPPLYSKKTCLDGQVFLIWQGSHIHNGGTWDSQNRGFCRTWDISFAAAGR